MPRTDYEATYMYLAKKRVKFTVEEQNRWRSIIIAGVDMPPLRFRPDGSRDDAKQAAQGPGTA